ncbi:MAG: 6-pyruvoyl-tetrahydropterin synthase-related protein [Candidatus Aenigmatarchaeota archaeon]
MKTESVLGFVSIVIVSAFLLQHFKPDLLFSQTTVSGGDTGSHNYLFYYMRTSLLPNLELIGWSPDWYLGFPAFQFYFPLAYALGAILSYLINPNIATKIITVLGTFLLPVSAYLAMRMLKFDEPIPSISAFFSLIFLFIESNSVWGGNIPSTLSGEFSYSLSFALAFLFLASLYGSMPKNKTGVRNSVLFAAIVLTHIYTAIFAFIASLLIAALGERNKLLGNITLLAKTYALSFALVGFWALPLLFNIGYKTDFGYRWTIENVLTIFPKIYLPMLVLAVTGFKIGASKRDRRVLFLVSLMLLALLLYLVSQFIGLVDVRFLPFMQFSGVLIAAYGAGSIIKNIKPVYASALIVGLLTVLWVNSNISYIDGWISWNYGGYESKSAWSQFNDINTFLKDLPYGRIFHEYSPSHSKFGTPRAFEAFPMFTGKPVVEGLTIESGLLAPFTFYMQSELSQSPTCPIPSLKCSYFDAANGTKHLELFNIRYVVATSDKLKNALDNITAYKKLKSFGEISVYELMADGHYAVTPKYEPVAVVTDDWRNISMEWFRNTELADVPLVFVNKNDSRFSQTIYGNDLSEIKKIPLTAECDINETIRNESVLIKTSCTGRPLLVKIPYFPDWTAYGAEKIYMVSPGFMLVFPSKDTVELKYGSLITTTGKALTVAGIIYVVACLLFPGFRRKFQYHYHANHVKKH